MTESSPLENTTAVSHSIDHDGVKAAVHLFLKSIGDNPDREGLQDTPDRIARACDEIFGGLSHTPEDIFAKHFEVKTSSMVLVRDIHFFSMCEHHLLPFFGVVHIGYIPQESHVVGLSKLARLVEVYARRPQVQERLTEQIADALVTYAHAQGVIVVLEAHHMCMMMRGVEKRESTTLTSTVRGTLTNPAVRSEALQLIMQKSN
ncbi:MAG: GTP cyclohydrolase I FolE [Aeriscardovia sp.]|nr:GTP cyclohydrolase I FolE [Aeriscardovia sp.]